jgi:hypothetical protein
LEFPPLLNPPPLDPPLPKTWKLPPDEPPRPELDLGDEFRRELPLFEFPLLEFPPFPKF